MEKLPSGLDRVVADSEPLARFLTSSSQFNSLMAKPSAFLPNPKDGATSVFRHGTDPSATLWQIGLDFVVGDRTLYGAAIISALEVRRALLGLEAVEPPPLHCNIVGWPSVESDPELEKAQRKERAALISRSAVLIRR